MEAVMDTVYKTDHDKFLNFPNIPFYYVKPITGSNVRSIRIVHNEGIISQHKVIITGSWLPINS